MIRPAVALLVALFTIHPTALRAMSGATVRAVPPNGTDLQCVSLTSGSFVWDSCTRKNSRTITGTDTALTTDDILFLNSASDFTVNLYTCSGNTGRQLILKNINTGNVTIDADGAETIDGLTTHVISMIYSSRTLYCNGTSWSIL